MSDDEDEDTHFCLRCNSTITGLDAYVAHRKSKCNQQSIDTYGPGPSGLQDVPLTSEERRHVGSPGKFRPNPVQILKFRFINFFIWIIFLQKGHVKTVKMISFYNHRHTKLTTTFSRHFVFKAVRKQENQRLPSDHMVF